MLKKWLIKFGSWAVILFSMVTLASNTVFAATQHDVITSFKVVDAQGNPETKTFGIWENFKILGEFRLPDTGVQAGDTTRIMLPNTIVYTSPNTTFELAAPNGNVVANASVNKDTGEILITYTNYASMHSGTTGSFYFDARMNHIVVRDPGPVPLEFDVEGRKVTSNAVNFEGVGEIPALPLVKSSWPTPNDPQSVSYFIAVNRKGDALTNVTFVDQLQNIDGKIDLNSLEIYKGKWKFNPATVDYELEGQTDVTAQFAAVATQSADGQTVTIPFGDIETGEGYILLYKVKLNYMPVDGEQFVNTATTSADNGYFQSSQATATFVEAGGQAAGYKYTIEIKKVNEANEPLAGAKFDVIRKATNQKVGEITTDAGGTGQVTNLLRTEYILKETQAPAGYQLSLTDVEVAAADFNAVGTATKMIVNQAEQPATTSVAVTKQWDDANNQDGLRQDITVNLFKTVGGVKTLVLAQQLTAALVDPTDMNVWKYVFEQLPTMEGNQPIAYTVEEVALAGYTALVTGDAANGYTITNGHTPEVTDYTVTKVWDDANNQDQKRPAAITVRLVKTVAGVETEVANKTVTVADQTADNTWSTTFSGLAKYEAGQLVQYSVKEDAVAGYTTVINGNTITNSYTPTPPVANNVGDALTDPKKDSSSTTVVKEQSKETKQKQENELPNTGTTPTTMIQQFAMLIFLAGVFFVGSMKRNRI